MMNTPPLEGSIEDVFDQYLDVSTMSLPEAYGRKYNYDLFIDRLIQVEDSQGNIEQIKVSELPAKIIGRAGVILGAAGIGRTSTIRMVLRHSISRWRTLGIIPIIVSAEAIVALGYDPNSISDALREDIAICFPGNLHQQESLHQFIRSKIREGKATILIDNADKLCLSEQNRLQLSMEESKSVFYCLAPNQVERSRKNAEDRGMKIHIPSWGMEIAEELSEKLFSLVSVELIDRQVYKLRVGEYPEILTHPLSIMAAFEQTLLHDSIAPVIMEKFVSELFQRDGLPDPGPLCDPENKNKYSDYLLSIGKLFFSAVEDLCGRGKIISSVDLSSIDIEDPGTNKMDIEERFKRRFFYPGLQMGTLRCQNTGIIILLAALYATARPIDKGKLPDMHSFPTAAIERINLMDWQLWEYQSNLHNPIFSRNGTSQFACSKIRIT